MNSAIICGFLDRDPELEYENKRGKKFLRMYLNVPRESGTVDMIPVVCREDKLIDADVLKVTGEVQTKNKDGHLDVYVYAREIAEGHDNEIGTNNININGFFCKDPVFRTTPLGKKICDMMVASDRDHHKSDYIPCICWGSKAKFAGWLSVGSNVLLNGRFQSREYVKHTDEGEETRIAYEVSCGGMELLSESEGIVMKLYKFMLTTYGETKITKQVLEAEEKPKTYSVFDGMWTSRVNKKDIGVASGFSRDTVILLEDDMKKAKEIFAENLKRKILVEKESIEQKIKNGNEQISNWEKAIDEIEEIKESEE